MKYRKKPVVIDAWRWDGDYEDSAPGWFAKARSLNYGQVGAIIRDYQDLVIHTLEGQHRANAGDWIICGVKGEIYPCKPDIFALTYEPA